MRGRLILAITTSILEELAIALIVLWGLPRINVNIPLWGLITIMVVWAVYDVFTYRLGTRALMKEHPVGLMNMLGCKGEVVSPLVPQGLVRIKGELWIAESTEGEIKKGSQVIVVEQQRLKLIVRADSGSDNPAITKTNNPHSQ